MVKLNATEKEVKIIQAVASALAELAIKPYVRHKSFERLVQDYTGRGVSLLEIKVVLGERLERFTFKVEKENG